MICIGRAPGEAAAIATLLTAGLQWLDRFSKRASEHVITKHGSGT